jgi:hypothetical protein
MKKYFAILFLMTLILSCTKEAKIKLPTQEEKLVVTCFISPADTVLTAVVRSSSPKYNVRKSNSIVEGITNAEVIISSDQGTGKFNYDKTSACYTLSPTDFAIFPGKKYFLTVKTPDGKQTSANTIVPSDTLPIKQFEVKMNYNEDSTQLDMNTLGEVAAIKGRTNYVAIFFRQIYVPSDTSIYSDYDPYENMGYGTFDDDEKQPHDSFVFQSRDGGYSGQSYFTQFYSDFWVLNCSKEFYLYNRSLQLASEVNDNPFGDPVFVYSNMDKGFGCFGAYMITKRSISR